VAVRGVVRRLREFPESVSLIDRIEVLGVEKALGGVGHRRDTEKDENLGTSPPDVTLTKGPISIKITPKTLFTEPWQTTCGGKRAVPCRLPKVARVAAYHGDAR
jgi:hypothetical protein